MSTHENNMPKHVGIIMDGNGRWAERRGLPRQAGHRAGVEVIRQLIPAAVELGIPYLSLFAFSTENWSRPESEVRYLWQLLEWYVREFREELKGSGARLRTIGRLQELPPDVVQAIRTAEGSTADGDKIQVILCLNYGGRAELLDAVKGLAKDVARGKLDPGVIDHAQLRSYFYAPDVPDLDLVIRTSGEYRLSNFYLWQAAYAEIWVTDVLWPDFTAEHLKQAIGWFQGRQRRFGGLKPC
ncbi:MAG: polyprenyl diphosphate synthase [Bacillota bacterium]